MEVSLQELIEAKIIAIIHVCDIRFESLQKALELAKAENDRRLHEMNEFRREHRDDKAEFLSSGVFDARMETIQKDILSLERWRSRVIGIQVGISALSGVIGAMIFSLLRR